VAREDRDREALFFSWAWHWVRSLWEKNGMCIDPDGRCAEGGTGSAPSQPDRGACIDPNGGCIQGGTGSAPIQPDQGACIEPNGGCVASPSSWGVSWPAGTA